MEVQEDGDKKYVGKFVHDLRRTAVQGRHAPWSIGDWRRGAMEGPMRSTDLFSIFLPKQWTNLRLRSTSLLSIPTAAPML